MPTTQVSFQSGALAAHPVGLPVGALVGADVVGWAVGLGVGPGVGLWVGLRVGAGVGVGVGLRVGAAVGSDDVGPRVGALVGLGVGLPVGAGVGLGVGAAVGPIVPESRHWWPQHAAHECTKNAPPFVPHPLQHWRGRSKYEHVAASAMAHSVGAAVGEFVRW